MDASTTEARAAQLLHGLGFTKTMQKKKTRDFSGGWRMRIALARALFVDPTFLILDEPTNHLDLEACVWLEDVLSQFKRILLLVSHSQDFMNGVCTNIINMHQKQLHYYAGVCWSAPCTTSSHLGLYPMLLRHVLVCALCSAEVQGTWQLAAGTSQVGT